MRSDSTKADLSKRDEVVLPGPGFNVVRSKRKTDELVEFLGFQFELYQHNLQKKKQEEEQKEI